MLMYGFIGLSMYMFIKKHPNESKNMLVYANSIVKYMPIDKGQQNYYTYNGFCIYKRKMSVFNRCA